jgi:hypothetical protein
MRAKILTVVALCLGTLVAVPAFAAPTQDAPAKAHRAEKEKASFPMPAASFKAKTDEHLAKAREHMEKRAAKLDAEKAKELRSKFNAGVATVNQEVAKATADGTVTQDEAKAVHQAMRSVKGGHKHAKKQ